MFSWSAKQGVVHGCDHLHAPAQLVKTVSRVNELELVRENWKSPWVLLMVEVRTEPQNKAQAVFILILEKNHRCPGDLYGFSYSDILKCVTVYVKRTLNF